MKSPAELNRRNQEFWNNQAVLVNECLAVPLVLERAIARVASEERRQIPVHYRLPFESALLEADRELKATREHVLEPIRAARSHRAKRPRGRIAEDGLTINQLIEEVFRKHSPDASTKTLWRALVAELGQRELHLKEKPSGRGHPDDLIYQIKKRKGQFIDLTTRRLSFKRFSNVVSVLRKHSVS